MAFQRSLDPKAKGSPSDAASTEAMDMQRKSKLRLNPLKIVKRPGFFAERPAFLGVFVYHMDNRWALDLCR
jgi:hypothetical protein